MMDCPYCGSSDVFYIGVDDGGGDYGDSVEDSYECGACEFQFGVSWPMVAEELPSSQEGIDQGFSPSMDDADYIPF